MPPIEVGPARGVSPVDARLARAAGGESPNPTAAAAIKTAGAAGKASATPSVETSTALDPGEVPVDTNRVQVIRKAVESGNYPVIPTKIADAIIAAGMLLRSPK